MNETVKRVALWVISIGGWGWAVGAATWAVLEFDPNHGNFAPQWLGLSVFLSMGFAIAAGVSIGRLNSVRTLTKVFGAGALSEQVKSNSKILDELSRKSEQVDRNSKSLSELNEKVK